MHDPDWLRTFAPLAGLEPDIERLILSGARRVSLAAGTAIYQPGQRPAGFLLLLHGDVRVSQVSDTGREIVLYRVLPGESCALTTIALIDAIEYSAQAVAEQVSTAILISRASFDEAMARSPVFRRFVLLGLGRRITDLVRLVDEIAFQRMDVRLAAKLVDLSGGRRDLAVTHQALADELGTAREVVSRLLVEFQRRGWVRSGRGHIDLTDHAALAHLAAEARHGDLVTDPGLLPRNTSGTSPRETPP